MTALVLHLLLGVGVVGLLDEIPDTAVRIAKAAARAERLGVGQVHHRTLEDIRLLQIRSP